MRITLKPLPTRSAAAQPPRNQRSAERQPQQNGANAENNRCPATNTNQQQQENEEEIEPFYGDVPGPLSDECFRIQCLNSGVLPVSHLDSSKYENLFAATRKHDVSILCLQELGNNWSMQPYEQQWRQKIADNFDMSETRTFCSHNLRDKSSARLQYGGTAILSRGKIAYYAMGAGSDKSKLGRWTWSRYRGKGGAIFRVVSMYRPCESHGALTVFSQHETYFRSVNDDRNPRDAFLQDLDEELQEWIDLGDHIVICGDLNQNIFSIDIQDLLDKYAFSNLIFQRHAVADCPASFNRNGNGDIIDGMWGTPGVSVVKCVRAR